MGTLSELVSFQKHGHIYSDLLSIQKIGCILETNRAVCDEHSALAGEIANPKPNYMWHIRCIFQHFGGVCQ